MTQPGPTVDKELEPLLGNEQRRGAEVVNPTGVIFRRRCLELLWALSLVAFAHIVVNIVAPFFYTGIQRLLDSRDIPIPDDIVLGQCANWTKSNSDIDASIHSAEFHLDARALLFVSQGSLSRGEIVVTQSRLATPTNKAKVNIAVKLDDPKFLDYVQVCEIREEYNEELGSGVGMFSVPWLSSQNSWFAVSVELPRMADSEDALNVESFVSRMPTFFHRFRGVEGIRFERLTISTSDRPIFAHSLSGERIIIETTNALIQGSFNVTEYLDLTTSNSIIDVDLGLHDLSPPHSSICEESRWEPHWPSLPAVELHNSNGFIRASANLTRAFDPAVIRRRRRWEEDEDCKPSDTSPSEQLIPSMSKALPVTLNDSNEIVYTGGRYSIVAKTTRGPIDIDFGETPLNHCLTLDASTSFDNTRVVIPPTYEGHWKMKALSPYRKIEDNRANYTDPTGENRERVLRVDRQNPFVEEGEVVWGPREDEEKRLSGWVELDSMFGRATIIV